MALSDSKKMKIVTLLGWPAKTLISTSTHYNTLIVDRLTNLSTEAESLVSAYLRDIAASDDKLDKSIKRAGFKKISDIEFNTGELSLLRGERKKLIRELGDLLDIAYVRKGGVNVGVVV